MERIQISSLFRLHPRFSSCVFTDPKRLNNPIELLPNSSDRNSPNLTRSVSTDHHHNEAGFVPLFLSVLNLDSLRLELDMARKPDSPFIDPTRKPEETVYKNDLKPLFEILNPDKRDEHITADVLFTENQPSAEATQQLFSQNIFRLQLGQSTGLKVYKNFTKSVASKYFSHIHHLEIHLYFGLEMRYGRERRDLEHILDVSSVSQLHRERVREATQFVTQCSGLKSVTLHLHSGCLESSTHVDGHAAYKLTNWRRVLSPLLKSVGLAKFYLYMETARTPKEVEESKCLEDWIQATVSGPKGQSEEARVVNATSEAISGDTTQKKDGGVRSRIVRGIDKAFAVDR